MFDVRPNSVNLLINRTSCLSHDSFGQFQPRALAENIIDVKSNSIGGGSIGGEDETSSDQVDARQVRLFPISAV